MKKFDSYRLELIVDNPIKQTTNNNLQCPITNLNYSRYAKF